MSFYSRRSSYWDQYDYIDENPICTKRALPENNQDDNECKLKEILNNKWFSALASTIKSNYDSKEYIGPEQYRSQNIIPRRSMIFKCLNIENNLSFNDWRVIIISDTVPNIRTANSYSGLPFYDNMSINNWLNNHNNNSIKYFYFNLLQYYKIIENNNLNYDEMIAILNEYNKLLILPKPYKWITYLQNNGIMFLNQCLTIGGNKEKDQHLRYWKPIIRAIIFSILSSKKNLKKRNGKKGTLFVVFDKKTKNFIRAIHSQIKINKKTQIKVIKMDYNFSIHFKKYFNHIKFFQQINDGLEQMNMNKIKWLNDDQIYKLNKIRKQLNKGNDINSDNEDIDLNKNENTNNCVKQSKDKNTNSNNSVKQSIDKNENNNEQKYNYNDGDSDEFSC